MATYRNRVLYSAIEATEGVNANPSATTDGIQVLDLEITVSSESVERELSKPWLGANPVVYTQKKTTFSFGVEVAGSGTAATPPAWGRYLQASGFSQTLVANNAAATATIPWTGAAVVYSPVSSGIISLTMVGNHDGIAYAAYGCRATSLEIEFSVSEIGRLNFEFEGAYVNPADLAFSTPTYTGQSKPLTFAAGNTTNATMDGYSPCIESVNIDLGLESVFRELVGCSKRTLITERLVELEVSIERPNLLADKNFYTKIDADEPFPFGFTQGTVSGNRVAFYQPNCQFTHPEADDSDGVLMHNFSGRALALSPGNNEMTIVTG
jgi:hypothetical protein